MSIWDKLITAVAPALAAALLAFLLNFQKPTPPAPVPPTPEQPPAQMPVAPTPKPDTLQAIMRISRPGVGCSATIIGPKRVDGRYWVLTAAHCTQGLNERWTGKLRNGTTVGFVIVARNTTSDWAWGITDANGEQLPFALLAEKTPPVGTPVWHAGYGVDKPGNREDGKVVSGYNSEGQVEFDLSVSSGDSGGGIVIDSDGAVVSAVCCTTGPGQRARVWGCSPESARRGQVVQTNLDEWAPLPIPTRMPNN